MALTISARNMAQLNAIAKGAYGVKNGSGKNGGLGVMAMENGYVFKSATGWFQHALFSIYPQSSVSEEAVHATQLLRLQLGQIITSIRRENDLKKDPATKQCLNRILKSLGLDEKGNIMASYGKKFLWRKTVAKALNELDRLQGESLEESVWGNAAKEAKSLSDYEEVQHGSFKEEEYPHLKQYAQFDGNGNFDSKATQDAAMGKISNRAANEKNVKRFNDKFCPKIIEGLGNIRSGELTEDASPMFDGRKTIFDAHPDSKDGVESIVKGAMQTIFLSSFRNVRLQGLDEFKNATEALKTYLGDDAEKVLDYVARMMQLAGTELDLNIRPQPFGRRPNTKLDIGLSSNIKSRVDALKGTLFENLDKLVDAHVMQTNYGSWYGKTDDK